MIYLKNNYLKFVILLVSLFGIFILSSCKTIKLIPEHDTIIAQEIDETAKKIDLFYLDMLEKTSNDTGERSYKKFVDQYVTIEVALNSILAKNKLRELNENSVKISENTVELWVRYKSRHKENDSISDANIELNRKSMADQMYILALSEGYKF